MNWLDRKSTINKTQHRQYRDQKYYIVSVLYIAIDKQLWLKREANFDIVSFFGK